MGSYLGATTPTSIVEMEYEPCACSPMGKLKRTTRPFAPGGTKYWTTYSYDALGRTTSVAMPGQHGSSTTSYLANVTTQTDPAGKWKKFTRDALGRITQLEEDPGGVFTSYTYNHRDQLLTVTMPRPTGTRFERSCTTPTAGSSRRRTRRTAR